jgi:hypothetical protein
VDGDGANRGLDLRQIRSATLPFGRPDSEKDHRSGRDCVRDLGREPQTAGASISPDELRKARLEEWDLAAFERVDPRRVRIHAHDGMAEVSEARTADEPDISCPDDRYIHGRFRYQQYGKASAPTCVARGALKG